MRKKEIVAAVCVVALCIAAACGFYFYQHIQTRQQTDAHNAKLAQITAPGPGEDILIDDPEDKSFTGSLSIRVLDAVLYDDVNAAGQAEGFDSSEVGQELFTDQMKRDDPFNVLVLHVSVKNIDATPVAKSSKTAGAALFFMGELANPSPSNEPLYLVGGEQGSRYGPLLSRPGVGEDIYSGIRRTQGRCRRQLVHHLGRRWPHLPHEPHGDGQKRGEAMSSLIRLELRKALANRWFFISLGLALALALASAFISAEATLS